MNYNSFSPVPVTVASSLGFDLVAATARGDTVVVLSFSGGLSNELLSVQLPTTSFFLGIRLGGVSTFAATAFAVPITEFAGM
ncbi:hypothetical protein AT1G58223 [Arabidopsis thaliana]|nr:uncharacterized protein AT1G58223 [Arabidopsis thaliana]ANM59030.1 hypothetical protein AT1G58223 [Arabidopsis thaliana]|eukprot:NP_001321425.1 hypothetical protein AT1G58223 [Arabidopsis thaliana]